MLDIFIHFILGHIGIGHFRVSVEFPEQNVPPFIGRLQLRDLIEVAFPQTAGHGDQGLQSNQDPFPKIEIVNQISRSLLLFANKFSAVGKIIQIIS